VVRAVGPCERLDVGLWAADQAAGQLVGLTVDIAVRCRPRLIDLSPERELVVPVPSVNRQCASCEQQKGALFDEDAPFDVLA
jgi:hypothetical protein